jgi:hypothetical protein
VPVLNVILAAAGMVPRLPDATLHMLGKRLRRGHLEFSLGMLFILGYITVMVVALRQQGPVIWYFALAVVAGPWLVIGIFWILKHLLAGASYEAEKIATFFITAIGLPGCLMVCIHHDLESLGKILGGLRKGVGLFS